MAEEEGVWGLWGTRLTNGPLQCLTPEKQGLSLSTFYNCYNIYMIYIIAYTYAKYLVFL